MSSIEEIKVFAEAEGFSVKACGHFTRSVVPLVMHCELCGDTGFYFLAHETAWPPAAIAMMMADRARGDDIPPAVKVAQAALCIMVMVMMQDKLATDGNLDKGARSAD